VALADRFLATSLPEVRPPLDGLADRAAGFDHLAIEAEAVARLAEELDRRLSNDGLSELYYRIEAPLSKTLAKMERAGIGVDREQLLQVMADLEQESAETERRIHALAGHPFKISSTQQLQKVLFDELGLPHQRKTKTGYSTSAGALEPLRGSHAIVEEVLRYREVEKLRSTYGESLLKEVQPDGRIRATFNQTVARTGRLSSDHPNLHNIPVRTAEGRRIRRAFVPRDGWTLLAADYEQIELRVIAHLSGDPGLVHAFAAGEDVHRATAARVFEVPPNEVTFAQRNRAKMVAYGLAYGMEPYGLAQRLAIPVDEADEIMKAFFAAFPAISGYMASVVAEARSRGYTVTALGRRRPIPELSSANRHVRQAGERQAMNAGVQGLAADVFKLALVRLDQALEAEQLASRIVLQVHDEVVLEVEPSERHRVGAMTDRIMRAAGEEAGLTVPLAVSLGWGQTWADAKA
jgi:DNA polymerase-1